MNNAHLSSLPKPPARFLVSAPTLKKLASQQFALEICRHTAHNKVDVCDDQYEWDDFIDDVPSDPDVPAGIPAVTKMVTDSLWDPVAYSVRRWFTYHAARVFFDRENVDVNEIFVKCIDAFVLKPDGTVNYLKTAQNLLLGDLLSHVEKFRLACTTCMTDDIRNIWLFVSDDPLVLNYDAQHHPILNYWTCGMQQGDLPRLPGGDDAGSLEEFANIMKRVEWSVIEYFWNFLTNDEQIMLAGNLFKKKCEGAESTTPEQLLFKLTSKQLQSIIKKYDIMDDLLHYFFDDTSECGVCFLQVWHFLVYFIRQSELHLILADFVKLTFRGNLHYNCQLVNEIWINTPVHLKRSLFRNEDFLETIFDALDTSKMKRIKHWNHNMSFFVTLLTEFSFQRRENMWRQYWLDLIVGTAPSFLQQIMKLCFNNDDEITFFKESHMMYFSKIHNFSCLLIRSRRVKELNDYLLFCSTNIHYTSTVRRQILASTDVQTAFLKSASCSSFVQFDQFIESAFIHTSEAREYKKKLMLSSQYLQDIYQLIEKDRLGVSWY